MKSSGFRILEHPADLGIQAYGRTLSVAFEECALGLITIFTDPSRVAAEEERAVSIQAQDIDQLLVKWLEEILYQYDGRGFVARRAVVHHLSATQLEGVLLGEELRPGLHTARLDVKAITYHQLSIRQQEEGFVVTVYVDI